MNDNSRIYNFRFDIEGVFRIWNTSFMHTLGEIEMMEFIYYENPLICTGDEVIDGLMDRLKLRSFIESEELF